MSIFPSPSEPAPTDGFRLRGLNQPSGARSPSGALINALLDCAWDLFAVMDAGGRVRYVSPSNERLLGYAVRDLVGRNGFDFVHPEDRSELAEAMERLREEPTVPITFKHRFRAANGDWRMLESTLQNKLDHPTLRGWVVHSRDVTDQDLLHAELARMQQAVRRLQLHPHFVLNVLHTVQTQLLSDPAAAAETVADFGDLLRLSYAHVDSAMVPLGHEIDFLKRYVDLYRHRFAEPISATFDIPGELRTVPVPSLLLQPLVENALLHGLRPAAGGQLTVRARKNEECLEIIVVDDGIGLRPDGDPSGNDDAAGDHVGLSTLRTRLRQMYGAGAALSLESRPNGGTIAHITLPLAPPPTDASLGNDRS